MARGGGGAGPPRPTAVAGGGPNDRRNGKAHPGRPGAGADGLSAAFEGELVGAGYGGTGSFGDLGGLFSHSWGANERRGGGNAKGENFLQGEGSCSVVSTWRPQRLDTFKGATFAKFFGAGWVS